MTQKRIIILITLFTFPIFLSAQVPEFDQMEMRYHQLHYKHVYRNAQKLLDNPSYDYSYIPRYYLALTQLQLAQDKRWRRRHKQSIGDAIKTLESLQSTVDGNKLLTAHKYELSTLKKDLIHWMYLLQKDHDQKLFNQIKALINTFFDTVPDVEKLHDDRIIIPDKDKITSTIPPKKGKKEGKENTSTSAHGTLIEERKEVTTYAKKLLGVPYKWSGESPKGFDCSGFTSYVMKNSIDLSLSRTAAKQYKNAEKIKPKRVKPGDLVFFSNGSGVSHVGIVYSTNFDSIQMIHASTSVGVSVVDIYQSSYWKKRIKGFGRYIGN